MSVREEDRICRATVVYRPIDEDELDGALADLKCHAFSVTTGREDETSSEPLTPQRRARYARWLAETALALALHWEAES